MTTVGIKITITLIGKLPSHVRNVRKSQILTQIPGCFCDENHFCCITFGGVFLMDFLCKKHPQKFLALDAEKMTRGMGVAKCKKTVNSLQATATYGIVRKCLRCSRLTDIGLLRLPRI